MKRIILPAPDGFPLEFYLAVEEWVATNLPPDKYFFAWQVAPTVICGRHQDIGMEVDLDYARTHNIRIVRRKSGGGAVYADRANVMFSYITEADATRTVFSDYTALICSALATMGIDARPTGRNDIAIGDSKVAGNAFLKLPGRSIVHGTMLYDADFDAIARVLTPSRAKRMSKKVVSVPAHITTLRAEGLDISCQEFIDTMCRAICQENYALTDIDLEQVRHIMHTYEAYEPGDIDVSHRPTTIPTYINGVGQITLELTVAPDRTITSARLTGDFFASADANAVIDTALNGTPADRNSIHKILDSLSLQNIIVGFKPEHITELIRLSITET